MKNKGDMIKKGLGGKNQKILPFLDVKSSKSTESVYRSIPIRCLSAACHGGYVGPAVYQLSALANHQLFS